MTGPPELPTLQPGIQLLHTETRHVEALHALVLDHLIMHDGPAYWVDSHGNAITTALAKLAPSRRTLDRIQVARGFTGYQHYAAIDHLPAHLDASVAVAVVPALDYLYRGDDIPPGQAAQMITDIADQLVQLADHWTIPVLVTLDTHDDLTAPITTAATDTLTCERTRYGPRFTADEFETLVYPTERGMLQTTITYWREILAARARSHAHQPVEVGYGAD